MSTQNTRSRLRVTLALPSTEIPAWVCGIQARLQDAEFVALTTVAVEQDPVPELGRSLIFKLWMRLETKVFGHKIAAREHSEMLVSFAAQPDPLPDNLEADVIVWMLPGRPPPELIGKAKHGVMTIAGAFDTMFGLNEFLQQKSSAGGRPGNIHTMTSVSRLSGNGSGWTAKLTRFSECSPPAIL